MTGTDPGAMGNSKLHRHDFPRFLVQFVVASFSLFAFCREHRWGLVPESADVDCRGVVRRHRWGAELLFLTVVSVSGDFKLPGHVTLLLHGVCQGTAGRHPTGLTSDHSVSQLSMAVGLFVLRLRSSCRALPPRSVSPGPSLVENHRGLRGGGGPPTPAQATDSHPIIDQATGRRFPD